ncbi:hypothetical protein ACLBUN_20945, partial [Pseudomonas aeruginosa]
MPVTIPDAQLEKGLAILAAPGDILGLQESVDEGVG